MKLEAIDYLRLKVHLDAFEIDEYEFLFVLANLDYNCESRRFTEMIKASMVRFVNNGGYPELGLTAKEYIEFLKLMNEWTTIDMWRLKNTHTDRRYDIAKYCVFNIGGNYYHYEFMAFIQSLKLKGE